MKKTARMAALVGIAVLTLGGCGERPTDTDTDEGASPTDATSATETTSAPAEQHPDFKACMVSDSGGFDDQSFNQTSHAGLLAAKEKYGIQTNQAESDSDADYGPNIRNLVRDGCDNITTVGFLLGPATEAAAKRYKQVDFQIVDFAYENPPPNLKGLVFATEQPSFLAGYMAAATSESGIVGTFGGAKIPSVTAFMDGFVQGVERYNEDKGEEVQVVGWDMAAQEGSFTDDFENQSVGKRVAEGLINDGADIIFPVAGPAGLGGLEAAKQAGVKGIWVDTDGCRSTDYCDILLTSVVKGMDVAVEAGIKESIDGTFSNELYAGTLENGGVGLAEEPHESVSDETLSEVEALQEAIVAGEIEVTVGG